MHRSVYLNLMALYDLFLKFYKKLLYVTCNDMKQHEILQIKSWK